MPVRLERSRIFAVRSTAILTFSASIVDAGRTRRAEVC